MIKLREVRKRTWYLWTVWVMAFGLTVHAMWMHDFPQAIFVLLCADKAAGKS